MKVVTIAGRKRHGKDTVGGIFHSMTSYSRSLSFAKPMKYIVAETFDITEEQLEYAKNNGRLKAFFKFRKLVFLIVDFRKILQRFGTEAMKPVFGDNVWTKLLRNKIVDKDMTYIITDWRFANEVQSTDIKILVYNPSVPKDSNEHVSEKSLDKFKFDEVIINDGTIEDLQTKVKKIIKKYNLN